MYEIILDFFCRIVGVGAASGLLLNGDQLYLVSDNSNYLYEYRLSNQQLNKTLLIDNNGQNELVLKNLKLDLESITAADDTLYVLGSGSKENRHHLFKIPLENQNGYEHIYFDEQAKVLRDDLGISQDDYNIEGAFLHNGKYYLFNRGNGPAMKNGIMIIDTAFKEVAKFLPIALSFEDEGVPGFTDAIRRGNKVYFLAAVEHAESTYEDGKIGGSFFGVIDLDSMTLGGFMKFAVEHKFEGLTFFEERSDSLVFLLCEDPDDNGMESTIYKLSVAKELVGEQ